MKNTKHLIKFAEALTYKYANLNAEDYRPEIEENIRTALANVSSQNKPQVMLPFMSMLKKDNATLTFDVTRDDNWGRKTITVSNFSVIPGDNNAFDRYYPLVKQIKDYLEKNWELYPTQRNGTALDYNHFTIRCQYKGEAENAEPIAGN